MADVKATALPSTQAFDPNTDYLMAVRGDADGPRSGPYLIPGINVSVGSAASGGDGGGGTTPPPVVTGGITKVFGRTGPEIAAAASDYDANQIDYDPATSGLAADNVQTAIDAVAALRDTLPAPETDGDLLTVSGGAWTAQPPAVESVFGRPGAIEPQTGDYHADQIVVEKETSPGSGVFVDTANQFVTAAQVAKLTALDENLQVPDPTAATLGHVLTVVDDGGTNVAAFAEPTGVPGGGGSSGFVLAATALLRPNPAQPPTWVYNSGTGYWEFANSGTQSMLFEIDNWPGGTTVTISFLVSCSATSGNVSMPVQLAAITPGSADAWNKAYSSTVSAADAVADTVTKVKRISVAITGLDSVATGDWVRLKFWRDNAVGSNAAGAMQLRGVDVRFTA